MGIFLLPGSQPRSPHKKLSFTFSISLIVIFMWPIRSYHVTFQHFPLRISSAGAWSSSGYTSTAAGPCVGTTMVFLAHIFASAVPVWWCATALVNARRSTGRLDTTFSASLSLAWENHCNIITIAFYIPSFIVYKYHILLVQCLLHRIWIFSEFSF